VIRAAAGVVSFAGSETLMVIIAITSQSLPRGTVQGLDRRRMRDFTSVFADGRGTRFLLWVFNCQREPMAELGRERVR
jgi:hypothetical protein